MSKIEITSTMAVHREKYRSPTILFPCGQRRRPWRICLFVLVALLLTAALAPVIAPFPMEQKLLFRLRPPLGMDRAVDGYLFGTDELGRDIFEMSLCPPHISRSCLYRQPHRGSGGRCAGLLSGLGGRWADSLIMGLVDAVPFPLP